MIMSSSFAANIARMSMEEFFADRRPLQSSNRIVFWIHSCCLASQPPHESRGSTALEVMSAMKQFHGNESYCRSSSTCNAMRSKRYESKTGNLPFTQDS